MSKIFEAYKKRAVHETDRKVEIGRMASVVLYPAPQGPQVQDFNKLSNQVLGMRTDSRGTVLGIAASTSEEGSSFISYNLACTLAQVYDQRVAWIDANFLSPQGKLQSENTVGLAALLQDPLRVDDLKDGANPLLIPAGEDLIGAKGLLAGHNYTALVGRLARRFDMVILDLPPMLATRDTALMAAQADGFLLVIAQKHLKWEVIEYGLEALRNKGAHTLGAVINRRSFALPKLVYDRL